MPSIEFDDERPARGREELLAGVRRDGIRLRHRRHGLIGGLALVLVAALAIPVVAGSDGGSDPQRVAVLDEGPDTTVAQETTTTSTILEETTTTTVINDAAGPTTTRPRVTTTSTTIACRNSYDPRCGEFRWDPDPGPNANLTVEVTVSPADPKPGETVQFRVVTRDPDASRMGGWGCAPDFGDGTPRSCVTGLCASDGQPYGPWTPPERAPLHDEQVISHVYEMSGTYTFKIDRTSGDGDCAYPPNPYGSGGSGSATVTVRP